MVTHSQSSRAGPPTKAEPAVAALLTGQGIRFTSARRLVVRSLAEAAGPLSAGDLHAALHDRLPLSSLYRTLGVLEQAGALSKEHDAEGMARYELAEWLVGHHHHLVCAVCGEVRDVAVTPQAEATVGRLIEDIARRAGYEASRHRLDIEGTCPGCRTA